MLQRFLGPQLEAQKFNHVETKTTTEITDNFPEISLNMANISYGFPYQTPLSLPATEEPVKPAIPVADVIDPDVTQLDIYQNGVHLDTAKTQKRQLIIGEQDIEQDIWSQIRINCDEDEEYCM